MLCSSQKHIKIIQIVKCLLSLVCRSEFEQGEHEQPDPGCLPADHRSRRQCPLHHMATQTTLPHVQSVLRKKYRSFQRQSFFQFDTSIRKKNKNVSKSQKKNQKCLKCLINSWVVHASDNDQEQFQCALLLMDARSMEKIRKYFRKSRTQKWLTLKSSL